MNCQFIKYSDILEGKYDIDELEKLNNVQQARNPRAHLQSSNHYKDLIHDLIEAQSKCSDNLNLLGNILNQRAEHTNSSQKKYTQISELSSPNSQWHTPNKLNQSQVGQASPSQSFLNQLQNENILDQMDRLIKIRKLDSQILLRIIRKHMNECPQFVQLVKQEFRNSILS